MQDQTRGEPSSLCSSAQLSVAQGCSKCVWGCGGAVGGASGASRAFRISASHRQLLVLFFLASAATQPCLSAFLLFIADFPACIAVLARLWGLIQAGFFLGKQSLFGTSAPIFWWEVFGGNIPPPLEGICLLLLSAGLEYLILLSFYLLV